MSAARATGFISILGAVETFVRAGAGAALALGADGMLAGLITTGGGSGTATGGFGIATATGG